MKSANISNKTTTYIIILLLSVICILQIYILVSNSFKLDAIMRNQGNDNNMHTEIINKLEQELGEQSQN